MEELIPWKGPAILLVDLDAFFASVEQLDHPGWRGKPVIVGGDPDKHGVVATASYEARRYGVRSAMASSIAHQLCPDAIWTHGHYNRYKEVSSQVMEIFFDESPFVQQVSVDEAFVDISPTSHNTEHPILIAQRIQARVEELGVSCSIGIGTSKTIAKIASDMDKPRGLTAVYPGREKEFLAPLPVRALSGIGKAAEEKLHKFNIDTLGDLANADEDFIVKQFGKNGRVMYIRAHGKDNAPVEIEDEVKSVSNEVTFSKDLSTTKEVETAIAAIATKVGRRLRRKGLKGHTLSLKVRFDDRTVRSVQRRLDKNSDDDLMFIPVLFSMKNQIWKPGIPVRLLGVGVTGFEGGEYAQDKLFELGQDNGADEERKPLLENEQKRTGLLKATDKVKDRFGEDAVRFGHEFQMKNKGTNSGSKNPADYK